MIPIERKKENHCIGYTNTSTRKQIEKITNTNISKIMKRNITKKKIFNCINNHVTFLFQLTCGEQFNTLTITG
jgi:hypothetical protein